MKLNDFVKTTFDSLRAQLVGLEKRIEVLEKKAQKSLAHLQERLSGAAGQVERGFATARKQFRGAVTFATRGEVQALADKVEELADRIDRISRGERPRTAARKSEAA